MGAAEMAHLLRALAALPEDLGSIPSTNMTAHTCNWSYRLREGPDALTQTYMQAEYNAHLNKKTQGRE